MRILFALSLHTLLRHFESVVVELARRGHQVTLVTQDRGKAVKLPLVFQNQQRITHVSDALARGDHTGAVLRKTRAVRDYLHYRTGPFEHASKLRTRALRKMVQAVSDETESHMSARSPTGHKVKDDDLMTMMVNAFGGDTGTAALDQFLSQIESSIPADDALKTFLTRGRFDVVLVTPLVNFLSPQPDLVKAAKAVGIPVIFPVFSWDNLSTKGIIHVPPDALIVWNERQRDEAVLLHGVPADRVAVTGAPRFDRFLERTAEEDRATFCARHGLDPSERVIAYVGSSEFVSVREVDFVREWLGRIRGDARRSRCGIVIRPHPRMREPWTAFDTTPWPHVAVAPPRAADSDQTLRDLLEHASAVVGLNTSAELEAGLVGRPVFTITTSDYADGQQSTLHFHYLLEDHGGFVRVARSLDEHVTQLNDALDGRVDYQRIRDFMTRFVRPAGWDKPVTPLVVDTIEALAAGGSLAPRHASDEAAVPKAAS
jgi:hypothetical protein